MSAIYLALLWLVLIKPVTISSAALPKDQQIDSKTLLPCARSSQLPETIQSKYEYPKNGQNALFSNFHNLQFLKSFFKKKLIFKQLDAPHAALPERAPTLHSVHLGTWSSLQILVFRNGCLMPSMEIYCRLFKKRQWASCTSWCHECSSLPQIQGICAKNHKQPLISLILFLGFP